MKALPRRIGELEERYDRWLQAKQRERVRAAYMRIVRHAQRLERRRQKRRQVAAASKAEAPRKAAAVLRAQLAADSAREEEERKAADVARNLAKGNAGETRREDAEVSNVDVGTGWVGEYCRWVPLHERAGRCDSIGTTLFEHEAHDDY